MGLADLVSTMSVKKPEDVCCSFCGVSTTTGAQTIVTGPSAAICGPCATEAARIATDGSTSSRIFEPVGVTPFGGHLGRLRVPTGWVISAGDAIAFVPDVAGLWVLPKTSHD